MKAIDDFSSTSLTLIEKRLREAPKERVASDAREAAVLISLVSNAGVPSILFTKRTETVGTHKGQVSFPGGMRDESDEDAIQTALRETHEEIGIVPTDILVLGRFHEMPAITNVRVKSIVGFLGEVDLQSLQVSKAEIDEVFLISLRDLLDPSRRAERTYERRGTKGSFPIFKAGPHPVWGLTALITRRFLTEILGQTFAPALLDV